MHHWRTIRGSAGNYSWGLYSVQTSMAQREREIYADVGLLRNLLIILLNSEFYRTYVINEGNERHILCIIYNQCIQLR